VLRRASAEQLDEGARGVLFVTVVEAGNVLQHHGGLLGRFHGLPFFELKAGSLVHTCRLAHNKKTDKVCSETLRLNLVNPKGKRLALKLWTDSSCKAEPLGQVSVDLAKVVEVKGAIEKVLPLAIRDETSPGGSDMPMANLSVPSNLTSCKSSGSEIPIPWLRVRLAWLSRAQARISDAGGPRPGDGEAIPEDLPRFVFVRLEQATNLRAAHRNGFSAPYCVLECSSEHDAHSGEEANLSHPQASRVIQRTTNPVWRQDFTFAICRPSSAMLRLHVFSGRAGLAGTLGRKELLGSATVPLSEMIRHSGPKDVPLRGTGTAKSIVTLACSLGPVAGSGLMPSQQPLRRQASAAALLSGLVGGWMAADAPDQDADGSGSEAEPEAS